MTRKRISVLALTLGALAMLAYGVAAAQNPPPGPPGPGFGGPGMMGHMRLFRGLDLTPQQRDQLKATFEAQKDQTKAVMDRLRTLNQSLEAELFADSPDQGKIEQLKTDLSQAQQDALNARIAMQLKISQFLTPEQRQKLRAAQAQRMNGPRGRRGPRGSGRGPAAPGGRG